MKKRVSAGILAAAVCLTLLQPAVGVVINVHASETPAVIKDWSWTAKEGQLTPVPGASGTWEVTVPADTSREDLETQLPDAIAAQIEVSVEPPPAEPETPEVPDPPSEPNGSDEAVPPSGSENPDGTGEAGTPGDAGSPEEDTPVAARDLSVSDDEAPASDPGEGGTPLAGDPAPQPLEEHPISLTWDLSDYPNAPVPGKEYPVSATLADGYVLANGDTSIPVTIQLETAPAGSLESVLKQHEVTDTVSPIGTVINFFDYWIEKNRFDSDFLTLEQDSSTLNKGINLNHSLKFGKDIGSQTPPNLSSINKWTDNDGYPRPGIVENRLGDDGYPQLRGDRTSAAWASPMAFLGQNPCNTCLIRIQRLPERQPSPKSAVCSGWTTRATTITMPTP